MLTTLEQPRIDPRDLGKLRWRCRRGLLENDLLIERFFARHEHNLTQTQADALMQLMDLSDNDLLDLLLRRKEPESGSPLDTPSVHGVLALLRPTFNRAEPGLAPA